MKNYLKHQWLRRLMCVFGIHHIQLFGGHDHGVWCIICHKTRYCEGDACGVRLGFGTYIMEYDFSVEDLNED